MSDNTSKKDTSPLTSPDQDKDEARKTRAVKKPKMRNRLDDALDPERDTVIMSRNNPLLQRALSQQASSESNSTTTMSESREVVLLIRGVAERIMMNEDSSYTLGRFDAGAKKDDEIDLTPYGAIDRGVSRHHAILHLEDNNLHITDLDSTNGTYVGGKQLEPHEPTIIHKGDEVMLGRLTIQIMFR